MWVSKIALQQDGDHVQVLVNVDGQWFEVIRCPLASLERGFKMVTSKQMAQKLRRAKKKKEREAIAGSLRKRRRK